MGLSEHWLPKLDEGRERWEATGGMGRAPSIRQQGRRRNFEIQVRNENMTRVGSVKPQHSQGPMPDAGLPHDRTRGAAAETMDPAPACATTE